MKINKEAKNIIYKAMIKECEYLDVLGVNGHHLAQRLTELIYEALKKVSKKKK